MPEIRQESWVRLGPRPWYAACWPRPSLLDRWAGRLPLSKLHSMRLVEACAGGGPALRQF